VSYKPLVVSLLIALLSSCARTGSKGVVRIAILPVENLTADAELSWISAALQQGVVTQLDGAPDLTVLASFDSNDALQDRASRVLKAYVTRRGSSLQVNAQIRDVDSGKTMHTMDSLSSSPLDLAAAMARAVWPQAKAFTTTNPGAFEKFGRAIYRKPVAESVPLLREALAADPQFLDAQIWLASQLAASGDRPGALEALRGQDPSDPLRLARKQLAMGSLQQDSKARMDAFASILRLAPRDSNSARQAGQLGMLSRQFAQAAAAYRQAVATDPENAGLYNEAAYAYFFAGDLNAALSSVDIYARLSPGANPLDSKAEILHMAGRFDEASKTFEAAYSKEPAFLGSITLRKAAESRRKAGDAAAADALFQRYLDALGQNPLAPLLRAQWDYSSGRKQRAVENAMKLAEGGSSVAWSQLAIWRLLDGGDARAAAAQAAKTMRSPVDRRAAAVAFFATQPKADGAEWNRRAEKFFQSPADVEFRRQTLAYTLLLHKQWADAAKIIEELWRAQGPATATQLQALLARAWRESGRAKDAQALETIHPLPVSVPDWLMECLLIPVAQSSRPVALR